MASKPLSLFRSLRPTQWVKNTPIFAGLVFAKELFHSDIFLNVLSGFVLFCCMASAVYLVNDLADKEKDRLHPEKAKRPIASGEVSEPAAVLLSLCLAAAALTGAFFLDPFFLVIISVYLVMNLAYSSLLKHLVIIDVMCLAFGFLLRVLAGTTLAEVQPSDWLIICTVALALFLGFSKRRQELASLGAESNNHRRVLADYSVYFLDQMIAVVTAMTIMSYALYTIADETVVRFGTNNLVLTIPFVLYGIYRYLYLVHICKAGGNPTSTVLKDKPMLFNALAWLGVVILVIYGQAFSKLMEYF
jgi:4-hydroxybenzoate polyprenyltransferase